MPRGEVGLFVEYCAKDFLDGTQLLGPWEELAYRRICDLIYTTNDRLPDDDKKLAWMTKTGRRWPAIKAALCAGEKPKIVIIQGYIHNDRCSRALGTATQKFAQQAMAGRASASTGKSLRNLKQHRTRSVICSDILPNETPNGHRTNHLTTKTPSESITTKKEPEGFDEWYAGYPHKVGRGAAAAKFAVARRIATTEELIAGVKSYVLTKPPDYPWCNPATWLFQKRWLDQPATNGHAVADQPNLIDDITPERIAAAAARIRQRMEGN